MAKASKKASKKAAPKKGSKSKSGGAKPAKLQQPAPGGPGKNVPQHEPLKPNYGGE